MDFHKKLRHHIREKNLSQQNVADKVGVSQGLVSHWCRGKGKPQLEEAILLAKHLGVGLDYLFDDSAPCLEGEDVELDGSNRRAMRQLGPKATWAILVEAMKARTGEGKGSEERGLEPYAQDAPWDKAPSSADKSERRA